MTSEIVKISRKDPEVVGNSVWGFYSKMYDCRNGDYIQIDDLKEWLHWHLKERTISTIYSDLQEALK